MQEAKFPPDGENWPRVTRILEATGIADFSKIRNAEYYLQRGTDVHMIAASICKGEPDYWSGSELEGYAAAWQAFLADTQFRPILVEQPVFHEQRKYRGTLDYAGYFGGSADLVQLDVKSGIVADWVKLQTAAYTACLPDLRKVMPELPEACDHPAAVKRCGVQLMKTGRYKISAAYPDYRTDSNYFFSLVATIHGRSLYGKTEILQEEM